MKDYSMTEKIVLKSIIGSLRMFRKEIVITPIFSGDKITRLIEKELADNPELFFVNGFKFMRSSKRMILYPRYRYDEASYKLIMESCRQTAERLVSRIRGKNDYSKVLQAHDFIARNVKYVKGVDNELHSIVGPLTKKQGVCEGYAKTFKYLLDIMDIPCLVVCGTSVEPGCSVEEKHVWNMAKLDGAWVHLDVTFDTTIRPGIMLRYDYFGLTNDQILLDHKYEINDYPIADSASLGYYERNKLVMHTRKQMKNFVLYKLRAGERECIFKLPDSASEENLENKVISEIENALHQQETSYRFTLHYNITRHIFQVSFEK